MGCQSSSCSTGSTWAASCTGCVSSSGVLGSGNFHDEYKLGKKLGEGAFGQVRLTKSSDGEERAVKVLDFQRGVLPAEAREEVKSWMQACGHENVVQLHQAFFDRNLGYIVMELCTCSIMDMLANNSSAGESDLSRVFRGMALGLAHVHEVGVVHRDVKPDNFLLGGPGGQTVKLADFGMAVGLKQGKHMRGVAGTAPYMSPEMIDGEAYDFGTDVWSLGVVAYLMLFGEFPFGPRTTSSDAMKSAVSRGKPAPYKPAEAGWGAPSEEAMAFAKCLIMRNVLRRVSSGEAVEHSFIAPEVVAPLPVLATPPKHSSSRLSAQPAARFARQATAQFKVRADPTVHRDLDELLQRLQAPSRPSVHGLGPAKAESSADRSRLCRSFSAIPGGSLNAGSTCAGESKPFVRPQLGRASTFDGSRDLTASELAAAQKAMFEEDDDDNSSCGDSVSDMSTTTGAGSLMTCSQPATMDMLPMMTMEARSNAACSHFPTMDSLPMPVMPPMPIDEDEPMDFPLTCPLRPLPTKALSYKCAPLRP